MICLLEGCRDPFTLGFFITAFLFNKMSTEKLWSSIDPKFFFKFYIWFSFRCIVYQNSMQLKLLHIFFITVFLNLDELRTYRLWTSI